MEHLDAIREASTALSRARARRDDSIRVAHAAGVPVAHIAEAAGVTRPTVYGIVNDGYSLPARSEWERILNEAAYALVEEGARIADAHAVARSSILDMKAKRLSGMFRSLPHNPKGTEDLLEANILVTHILQHNIH
ncbi:hypothetical protein JRG19_10065 [Pseudoclavibacter alba]|uniref:hypothetical protein n=1 Tax=Pseudoclavibacter albus TaxID=272241 RepID=UPI0019D038DE|nr:hypothetical protein [Pseudoclavibacter alba]MBN6778874.1 hypothetical protein [Pseudoclavibacter alba]